MTSPTIRQGALAATLLAIGLTAAACGADAEATEAPTIAPTAATTPEPAVIEPAATEATAPLATAPLATAPLATAPLATAAIEAPATAPPAMSASTEPATPSGPDGFDLGDNVRGTSVVSGPDLMAAMDPDDPQDAKNIEDIEALLEATGASLDQLTMLNAVAADGVTFVGAMRVDRADAELAKAAFVESTFNDLGEPRTVESEVGGKSVTQVFDDAVPDQPPLLVYASADTVWLVSGTEEAAETVVETLP